MRSLLFFSSLSLLASAWAMPASEPSSAGLSKAVAAISSKPTDAAAQAKDASKATSWSSLTSAQQQRLQPLQKIWPQLTSNQKKKWIEIAQLMPKLPQADQEKISNRMQEWVSLSPQERTLARFNFLSSKQITPEERQKQWQAYQALSDAERANLRALSAPDQVSGGVAPSVKPVHPSHKVALPTPTKSASVPSLPTGSTNKLAAAPLSAGVQSAAPKRLPKIVATSPLIGKKDAGMSNNATSTPTPLSEERVNSDADSRPSATAE
jgi:Protein of unknown function (DUF3106)